MDRSIPRGIGQRAGRGTTARHVLLTCGLLLAAPVGLFAQGGDNVRSFWVPTRNFYIPFSIDNDPRIVEVRLYAATDGRDYTYTARAKPAERRFTFQAKQDGIHSFIVQSVNQDGSLSPADLRTAAPNIRIYVDTQKPIVGLYPEKKEGFAAAIKWDIQDDNFDDVRAYYRSVRGGEWYPVLDLPRLRQGSHGWRPNVSGALEVQLQARDKAGNVGEKNVTITPQADGAGGGNFAPDPANNDIIYTNSKTFDLQFTLDRETVGPSKVAKIDIWKMRTGDRWRRCPETGTCREDQPAGNATVTVDSTGRWGFRLIPRSGVGLAERDPGPGDQPQIWVEVDQTAPQVKITNVVVSRPPDAAELTIYWTASDAFLRARPITIFYALKPQGDWKELAKDLQNSGSFSCKPDERQLPYEFYVKVVAIDEAGNPGQDSWRDAVKVDLKIPRIERIEVKPRDSRQETRGLPPSPTTSPVKRQPPPPGGPPSPSVPFTGPSSFDKPNP